MCSFYHANGLQALQLCSELLESRDIWSSLVSSQHLASAALSSYYMFNICFLNQIAKYLGGKTLPSMSKMPTFICEISGFLI